MINHPNLVLAKSGASPSEVAALVSEIKTTCPHLRVIGLMTIGELGRAPEIDFRV